MNSIFTNAFDQACNFRPRSFLLLTLLVSMAFGHAGATTWYTLADGAYNNASDVWSLDGVNSCGCAPGNYIAGPFDTVYVRHKISMTSNLRIGGRSEFFIDPGGSLQGPWDIRIANASLSNRGYLQFDDLIMQVSSHFFAVQQTDMTGSLTCNGSRVELSGTLNIDGDIENQNGGYFQIFGNSVLYVDGHYNNDGETHIDPGACVNIVADFINPATGNVTGAGHIHSFNDISNLGFWEENVSWCADGVGNGLPTAPSCVNCSTLPVELAAFDAIYQQETKAVALKWTTVYEQNNDFFSLERSSDGLNFSLLATVSADENASAGSQYLVMDTEPVTEHVVYRLRQTDKDGTTKVLGVAQLNLSDQGHFAAQLYPNPFSDRIRFRLENGSSSEVEITVTDLSGRKVFQQDIEKELAYQEAELDLGFLQAGTYLVQVRSGNQRQVQKVVKQ